MNRAVHEFQWEFSCTNILTEIRELPYGKIFLLGLLLIPNALLCADFLMTARLSKLVDVALGPLFSVTDFVEFLRTSERRTGDVPAPDPVHGMLLHGVNAKPSGSARAEQTALARALGWLTKDPKRKGMRGVHCDVCGIDLHLHCADLLFPPRHASWACMGCR